MSSRKQRQILLRWSSFRIRKLFPYFKQQIAQHLFVVFAKRNMGEDRFARFRITITKKLQINNAWWSVWAWPSWLGLLKVQHICIFWYRRRGGITEYLARQLESFLNCALFAGFRYSIIKQGLILERPRSKLNSKINGFTLVVSMDIIYKYIVFLQK